MSPCHKCDKCDQIIEPDEPPHQFAGYGCYVEFHAACCPREMDGSDCGQDHPKEEASEPTVDNPSPRAP